MHTSQMQLLNEISAGHDGPQIPPAKLAYFQERLRERIYDFIIGLFLAEQRNGLNKAKLARRIGKKAEVVNRWLGAPSNLTLDTVSDLLIGINAQELTLGSASLLSRSPVNYEHLDGTPSTYDLIEQSLGAVTALENSQKEPSSRRLASIEEAAGR